MWRLQEAITEAAMCIGKVVTLEIIAARSMHACGRGACRSDRSGSRGMHACCLVADKRSRAGSEGSMYLSSVERGVSESESEPAPPLRSYHTAVLNEMQVSVDVNVCRCLPIAIKPLWPQTTKIHKQLACRRS